jgi:beta-glucosidase
VSAAIARGFVETQRGIADAQADATFVHVDASLRYVGDVDAPEHSAEAKRLSQQAFLVEDLVTGRVGADHPLAALLAAHGVDDDELAWFAERAIAPDVMGVNYYPRHSTEVFETGVHHRGGFADPRPTRDDGTGGLTEMLALYAARYGAPVMVSETCVTGSPAERIEWLETSLAAVERIRSSGIDVVGYTWWPLFDMIEWTYRHSTEPPMTHRLTMGLFDLVETSTGLERRRNAVAARFEARARAARPAYERLQ